ncbi:quinone-dependent dihydroorotate dehydrogenase [Pedobacter sp.]|nr:quinone-dependent dihydroorotate dehydrogenase [Candidatus Saccharibacteria bacterium]
MARVVSSVLREQPAKQGVLMNVTISGITGSAYKKIAKPILFLQKPDGIHTRMIAASKVLQRIAPVRSIIRTSWAYQNETMLQQTVAGVTFKNPIGLSAGFDKSFEVPEMIKAVGFGFMEGGSMTYDVCEGNPRPWFYRLPKTESLVVYAGLANTGSAESIARIKGYSLDVFKDFPLNISVAKTNSPQAASEAEAIADYIGSLKRIKAACVGQIITLNISCPNTFGGEPFTTPEKLERLLGAVDGVKLKQPIFIKMPSGLSWKEYESLLKVAAKHAVTGLTVSNLAKDRSKIDLKDELPDTVKGNLSGRPTAKLSNDLIKQTYQTFGDRFIISGVGGVFLAEDAYEKIRLGATLVQLVTGLIFEGPQLIGQINKGLVRLLERDGYTHISQAIGVDAQNK